MFDYYWKFQEESENFSKNEWKLERKAFAFAEAVQISIDYILKQKLDLLELNNGDQLLNKRSALANKCHFFFF